MKIFCLAISLIVFHNPSNCQTEDFNHLGWSKADSVAKLYPHHSLANLNDLAIKLTSCLETDDAKFRAIYRWTCENIEYDHNLYLKNQKVRLETTDRNTLQQWNKRANKLMYEGLLKKHKTVCTGYAYLIRELCSLVGIKCVIVDGYGRGPSVNIGGLGFPNHQWNAVQLNGKWYLCDATWSAGYILMPSALYVKDFREAYFLCDPKTFVRNHYPIDSSWTLLDKKPTLEQFLNGPLIYYPFFEIGATQLTPSTFEISAVKGENIQFKFDSPNNSIGPISIHINNQTLETFSNTKRDVDGYYIINQKFLHKGLFIVHINYNNQNVLSYKVTVR